MGGREEAIIVTLEVMISQKSTRGTFTWQAWKTFKKCIVRE